MDDATQRVIAYFKQINEIPRCSKQEAKISGWLEQWARDRRFGVKTDTAGNMVIHVPATKGKENTPTVILQGHMDMVCEKRAGSDHDFSRDPIRMLPDGPWLTARETTLGADNGIAIALALALVDDPNVSHPPLELFFTVDEETGLTGVLEMDPDLLSGNILINLDSEDEGVFIVGCAGGRTLILTQPLALELLEGDWEQAKILVGGIKGGHSGIDIAKNRANANKIMARLLRAGIRSVPVRLMGLKGGTAQNVIPRRCEALIACPSRQVGALETTISDLAEIIRQEYEKTDPGIDIQIEKEGSVDAGLRGVSEDHMLTVANLLMALPSGPAEMTADFPLLVQTSSNMAMVEINDDALQVVSSQRSSVASRLDAICQAVESVGQMAGARAQTKSSYPSWPMDPESPLLERCFNLYREMFQTEPTVQIMHAGLECGVIGDRCRGMDMISLGPTIENPHSPSERLYLPSVGKVWQLMVGLLDSYG